MRIEIELDEAQPPSGRVTADGGQPVQFTGWLPLLGILERALARQIAPQHLGDQLNPR